MKNAPIALFWIAALFLGCNSGDQTPRTSSGTAPSGKKLRVVVTVGMVGDLVRTVGGDRIEVTQICGAGVDPHLYMPTRDDVQDIMESEAVFYCGLMLEGKMADTLEKVSRSKPVFAVTDAIDRGRLMAGEGDESGGSGQSHGDPHVWNDVSMWSECVELIRDELTRLAPEHGDQFAANATAYRAELAKLHAYGIQAIATIPEESRLLITSHDAFNYFGRAYGLDVRGIQGISTESEAGLQQINALVDLLIRRNVKAVFVESSVSPKNVEALIEGAASQGHKVVKGGMLFSDAMGRPGTYEGTYIGMLDHNLTTTTRALGGQADPGGFQGKLSGQTEH
ncbi:Periplasmic zinc-binding protein TroA precursor [Stieleria maiorica]|uniref:Periplasmic zinc-binding protein TroA n=1 Tax=Stieleria maiorica TaxID=2795974 RepID=A0A5B9MQU3_9BACT|nr:zinc ABC transporter substrate-binding protein [Stieleria maiorica]QEG01398.1 Periplasmic zinc-binding protein TroA precursor [Stieleria maiorica]